MTYCKNKISVFLRFLLLILFVSYYGSITLFYHAHRVNEQIIVHSHPFNNQEHSHSAAQYDLIKILSSFSGLAALTGLMLAIQFFGLRQTQKVKPDSHTRLIYAQVWFLRGPPSVSFI